MLTWDDIPESDQLPVFLKVLFLLSTLGSNYETGESSTARPTRGRGIDYGFVSTVDAEERRQGIRDVGYGGLGDIWVGPAKKSSSRDSTYDRGDLRGDSMDGWGGGGPLAYDEVLGSLDRIESGQSSRAQNRRDSCVCTRGPISRHTRIVHRQCTSFRTQQIRNVTPISDDWSNPEEEMPRCLFERKSTEGVKKQITLVSLTKEAQAVTSRNDSLAILRCTQYDQTAINHLKMIKKIEGMRLKIGEQGKCG
ncbi:hypothetical protein Tco_1237808 [Tanacetum coccineum]